jgi:adenine phosphoribosyltransferase
VQFRDITPLLANPRVFRVLIDQFVHRYFDTRPSAIAGLDARGFIIGSVLAYELNVGFVPIRKKGKLPPPVVDVAYDLEYGSGVLEMQTGRGRLLLIDDVLATGGTLGASAALARLAGYTLGGMAVLLDLGMVPDFRCDGFEARSVLQYG